MTARKSSDADSPGPQGERRRRARRRGFNRFLVRLWLSVAGAIAVLGFLVGQALLASRDQHDEQALVEAWSTARVLESDIRNLLQRIELALAVVGSRYAEEASRPVPDRSAVARAAQSVGETLPDLDTIRIADAQGLLVAGAGLAAGQEVSLADRSYFRRLREGRTSRLLVSEPLTGRLTGEPVLVFARRIDRADGTFAGIAVTSLPIERLVTTLGGADAGPGGSVELRAADLSLLARHPALRPAVILSNAAPEALQAQVEAGHGTGTFRGAFPVDGLERLAAFQRIAEYGLVVVVGRGREEILGHWRRDSATTASVALALVLVALGGGAFVHRAWRRQQTAARALAVRANTDALTGLPNRRWFFEHAAEDLARAERQETPLAVLMVDIDYFKAVNDAYGHSTGDIVLRHVSQACRHALRDVDAMGRVGGEEFAILLPDTPLEQAVEVAQRLRVAVEHEVVARPEGVPIGVTVSVGVAGREPGGNLDTLMSQADSALYDAKHAGRNRVATFRPRG